MPSQSWSDAARPLLGVHIHAYEPLATRVDPAAVKALLESASESLKPSGIPQAGPTAPTAAAAAVKPAVATSQAAAAADSPAPTISIEEFGKVDLRIARVDAAELVDGADKLLKLTVDLGHDGKRTIFAGIRSAYEPAPLVGRHVVVVANLAPRKMRFGVSEGMVLAAGPGGKEIFLVEPDSGAEPGMKVK